MSKLKTCRVMFGFLALFGILSCPAVAKDKLETEPVIVVSWGDSQPQNDHEIQVVVLQYNIEMSLSEMLSAAKVLVPDRTNEIGHLEYDVGSMLPFDRIIVKPKHKKVTVQSDMSAGAVLIFYTELLPQRMAHLHGRMYKVNTDRISECKGNKDKCESMMDNQ